MKKDVKLYNMILPTFMLLTMHPLMWIFSLTGNVVLDSVVLLLVSLIVFKKLDGKFYKKNILKVWGLGFLADFIGVGYLLLLDDIGWKYIMEFEESDSFIYNLMMDMHLVTFGQEYATVGSNLFLLSGILLAAVAIFLLDYFIVFKKTDMTKKQKMISALMFAVLTAPYTYFIPEESFDWYFALFRLGGV